MPKIPLQNKHGTKKRKETHVERWGLQVHKMGMMGEVMGMEFT